MVKWIPGTLNFISCSYDDTIVYWEPEDDDWTNKSKNSDLNIRNN